MEDHLGSSNLTLSTDGAVVSSEEYYPFGETSFGSYGRKRYRFCGKEKDEESGLYYYGLRYYNPWICRFISTDPLADKYPFYTPYQYAGNQPIIATDIDGAEPDQQNNGQTNSNPMNQEAYTGPEGEWAHNNPQEEIVINGTRDNTAKELAKNFATGVAIGIGVGLAFALVIATVASCGAVGIVAATAITYYGIYETGKAAHEVYTGKESSTGRALSDNERAKTAGELVGGMVAGYAVAKVMKGNSSKNEQRKKTEEIIEEPLEETTESSSNEIEQSTNSNSEQSSTTIEESPTEIKTGVDKITELSPYELEPTHSLTKSKKQMQKLKDEIIKDGKVIKEPIKYVLHNGKRFVVDGHHRLRIAKELGIEKVPVEEVQLPYGSYKTVNDFMFTQY